MTSPRYEFLTKLHEALQPRGYVEIGVQGGGSLALAQCDSVGIDPVYQVHIPLEVHHRVRINTSDAYFASEDAKLDLPEYVDLAFIDGMHLIEFALRDFLNIEKYAHSGTVVLIDDVLPYNAAIAVRNQPAGDWTGDVWKIIEIIHFCRPNLTLTLVDTQPTGTLVITGFSDEYIAENMIITIDQRDMEPPHWVLSREGAVSQEEALQIIMRGRS